MTIQPQPLRAWFVFTRDGARMRPTSGDARGRFNLPETARAAADRARLRSFSVRELCS